MCINVNKTSGIFNFLSLHKTYCLLPGTKRENAHFIVIFKENITGICFFFHFSSLLNVS